MSTVVSNQRPVEGASLDDVRDAIITMYYTTDNKARHIADDWLREVIKISFFNSSSFFSVSFSLWPRIVCIFAQYQKTQAAWQMADTFLMGDATGLRTQCDGAESLGCMC